MEALASSVISFVFFNVLAYTLPHSSKLKKSTRIRTQYVTMDVDDMLKNVSRKSTNMLSIRNSYIQTLFSV
jgi:DNA-directed RNA polymerase subunit L